MKNRAIKTISIIIFLGTILLLSYLFIDIFVVKRIELPIWTNKGEISYCAKITSILPYYLENKSTLPDSIKLLGFILLMAIPFDLALVFILREIDYKLLYHDSSFHWAIAGALVWVAFMVAKIFIKAYIFIDVIYLIIIILGIFVPNGEIKDPPPPPPSKCPYGGCM